MRCVILLAGLAGCTQYAHRSMHNAPPIVNLDEPPRNERGDPAAFTPGEQPGTETIAVFATPSILLGSGRFDNGKMATEPGIAFRFERLVDQGAAYLEPRAFAITLGTGLAQVTEDRPTIFGALYAELNYRFVVKVIPFDIGVGPALYPSASSQATNEHYDPDVGGQISLRIMILQIRARYMAETGLEVMAGYSIPIPFFFRRSR
jgi:hypothetical protein